MPASAAHTQRHCYLPPDSIALGLGCICSVPSRSQEACVWVIGGQEACLRYVHSFLVAGRVQERSFLHGPVCEGDHQEG